MTTDGNLRFRCVPLFFDRLNYTLDGGLEERGNVRSKSLSPNNFINKDELLYTSHWHIPIQSNLTGPNPNTRIFVL